MAFRKSKKLFGIFRVTATDRGLSLSAGVPGARVSVNSKGDVRRTVSVPGSGWYDTKKIGSLRQEAAPQIEGYRVLDDGEVFDLPAQPFFGKDSMRVLVVGEAFRMEDGEDVQDIPKSMVSNLRRAQNVVNVTIYGQARDGSGASEQVLPLVCLSVEQATALRAALAA